VDVVPTRRPRATHAERRARTRSALLEAAARGLSRYGYGNVVLEDVAREAGYTRGALYHLFEDKEDLGQRSLLFGLFAGNSSHSCSIACRTSGFE
jgi:AcrR family transcriptional regulator